MFGTSGRMSYDSFCVFLQLVHTGKLSGMFCATAQKKGKLRPHGQQITDVGVTRQESQLCSGYTAKSAMLGPHGKQKSAMLMFQAQSSSF